MVFVEDRQLLELSRSPKRSLFPVLNRAESMSPLIVLLALVPPLYVLAHRTLTPLDAMWGLKAIAVTTSDAAEVWIDPDRTGGKEIPLKWQPPLSTWLIAGVMSLTGTERPLALVLCSFLATAGLVVSVFGLADRLRGPQFAWWTTCLVAMHGPILQGAQTPAPVSLTLAFAVGTCWGFVVHRQDSRRLFSLPLAWGGISWGLCLLAGGPVALVIVAILLLYVISLRQESKASKKTDGGKSPKKTWKGRPALQSLGGLLLVGVVVGGWWEAWLFFRHGFEFLQSWFAGATTLPGFPMADLSLGRQLLYDMSQMGGALVGLTILGLIVGLWMLLQPFGRFERSSLMLMIGWAGCGALVWVSLRASSHGPTAFTIVWRGFCLIPATMLAALAIEQIGVRRIGSFGVLLGVGITLAVLLVVPVETGFGLVDTEGPLWPSILLVLRSIFHPDVPWLLAWFGRVSFLVALGLAIWWVLWRMLKNNDLRQRVFLGVMLGFFVVAHGLVGLLGVRQETLNDRALAALRNEMTQELGVARWTLVSPRRSPLTLRFVLASIWPQIESLEVDSWWDPQITQDLAEGDVPNGVHILIDYNDRETRIPILRLTDQAGNSHIIEFTPVGTPQILWNHRLRMYRLTDRIISR